MRSVVGREEGRACTNTTLITDLSQSRIDGGFVLLLGELLLVLGLVFQWRRFFAHAILSLLQRLVVGRPVLVVFCCNVLGRQVHSAFILHEPGPAK